MLFQVQMQVNPPHNLDPARFEELKLAEKRLAQTLQREGKWRHLWRVVGQYRNTSIFDVADNNELHDILTSLPLYAFMQIEIIPLCRHPSSIHQDDR